MDTKTIGSGLPSYQYATHANATPKQPQDSEITQNKINPAKETQDTGVSAQQQQEDASATQDRLDAIKQIVQERFTYPLGDTRVTFYRDKSGKYITISTSLKDGKITYTPEDNLVDQFQQMVPTSRRSGLVTEA